MRWLTYVGLLALLALSACSDKAAEQRQLQVALESRGNKFAKSEGDNLETLFLDLTAAQENHLNTERSLETKVD